MSGCSTQLRLCWCGLRILGLLPGSQSVRFPYTYPYKNRCGLAKTTYSYPVVSATDKKTSKVLLLVVLGLHAGFAIAIKILFFAHASPVGKKVSSPADGNGKEEDAAAMLFGF